MGLGVVAIADPPTAIRLKVPFSDGLGGVFLRHLLSNSQMGYVQTTSSLQFECDQFNL